MTVRIRSQQHSTKKGSATTSGVIRRGDCEALPLLSSKQWLLHVHHSLDLTFAIAFILQADVVLFLVAVAQAKHELVGHPHLKVSLFATEGKFFGRSVLFRVEFVIYSGTKLEDVANR